MAEEVMITIVSDCYIAGKVYAVDETLSVPSALAIELCSYNKARRGGKVEALASKKRPNEKNENEKKENQHAE